MKFIVLVAICMFFGAAHGFSWSSCDPNSAVKINSYTVTPNPLVNPGTASVNFDATLSRALSGDWKTDVDVQRTVAGIQLQVRCVLIDGQYIGSCSFAKCTDMFVLPYCSTASPQPECYLFALLHGHMIYVNPTCATSVPAGNVQVSKSNFGVPDLSATSINFMNSGDFAVTIKQSDSVGVIGCLNLKYTTKAA